MRKVWTSVIHRTVGFEVAFITWCTLSVLAFCGAWEDFPFLIERLSRKDWDQRLELFMVLVLQTALVPVNVVVFGISFFIVGAKSVKLLAQMWRDTRSLKATMSMVIERALRDLDDLPSRLIQDPRSCGPTILMIVMVVSSPVLMVIGATVVFPTVRRVVMSLGRGPCDRRAVGGVLLALCHEGRAWAVAKRNELLAQHPEAAQRLETRVLRRLSAGFSTTKARSRARL